MNDDPFDLGGYGDSLIFRRWLLRSGDEADVTLMTYGKCRIQKLEYPGAMTYSTSW